MYIKLPQTFVKQPVATILTKSEGLVEIFSCVDSGKVIARMKIDTITKVNHPGIVIGRDKLGRMWVAHNHYKVKQPTFDLLNDFSRTEQAKWDYRQVDYAPEVVVQRAIAEVRRGISYHTLAYNCQTFVNLIVQNKNKSEAVDKISNGAMWTGIIMTFLGFAAKNKGITTAGMTILGIGGVAKGVSRIRKE